MASYKEFTNVEGRGGVHLQARWEQSKDRITQRPAMARRAAVGLLFPTLGKIIFFSQTAVSSPTKLTVRLHLEAVESARERRTSLLAEFAYRLFTHPLA